MREIQLKDAKATLSSVVDDAVRGEIAHAPRRKQASVVKEIEPIAGDTDEQAGDERGNHHDDRRGSRATRRG